jgi:hypothetical protein
MGDLPEAAWHRSSFCSGGSCVEVALLDDRVAVRDSKDSGRILVFRQAEWVAFLEGARNGEFDLVSRRP